MTSEPITVWVVMTGSYENYGFSGVYWAAEEAMAAHPIPKDYKFPAEPSAYDMSQPSGWVQDEDGRWSNGMDWDNAASVEPVPLEGTNPYLASELT